MTSRRVSALSELESILDDRRRLQAASEKRVAERRDVLLKQAAAFEHASRLRMFADHCEAIGRTPDGAPLTEWLAFARSVAEDIDPTRERAR